VNRPILSLINLSEKFPELGRAMVTGSIPNQSQLPVWSLSL